MPNPDSHLARPWLEPPPVRVPGALQAAVGGHPLVAETLVRRGISDAAAARAFLDPACYQPAPPENLPDLVQAVERVGQAIRAGELICVWGDFDVDGQTATALLVSTLRDLGARVCYHIPNRQTESHGIHLPTLEQTLATGVTLVLTCDTGVAAHEAVDYARSRAVDVVITDHHDLPAELPKACAVVNPKRLLEADPLRELPGVGCAYKLAEALYARAGSPEAVEQYLDLVALGIVADVAKQTGDTRYLLQRGLAALKQGARLGLQELIALSELDPKWITEEHVGFVLAPRLNALGRLADANTAVEFLITTDRLRARLLAAEMEGLNNQRRLLCEQVEQAALAQIERDPSLLEHAALVLASPAWPGGVLGIVAGRLAERFNRPTVLLMTPPGELARGSARSVEGCNITAAIAAHKEMLHSFGGHPMAAGLVMDAENVPAFRLALSRTVASMCGGAGEVAPLVIDGYLPLSELSLDLVAEMERLAPFGPGNPPLTLVTRGLTLTGQRAVGRGEHLLLYVSDETGAVQKVIRWDGADLPLPEGRFDLAYTVRASNYRGQREVQVEWIDFRPLEEAAATLQPRPQALEIVDHRQALNPRGLLERLRAQEEVQVWAEAAHRAEMAGRDRTELEPGATLVIWTTPPSPAVLRAALERVKPRTVYLFGIDPGLDDAEQFLTRLAGLVKYALAHGGRARLDVLAAATAQRAVTVRVGLAWLAARGHCTVLKQENGELLLGPGGEPGDAEVEPITARLQALLEETAAYRAAFARSESARLFE